MTSSRPPSKGSKTAKPENDADIWQRAMHGTQPLVPRHRRATELDEGKFDHPAETKPSSHQAIRQRAIPPNQKQTPFVALPGRLDKHVARRLKRGTQNIEASLDLHGMTQKEAHTNLRHFIRDTVVRGCRCVLVITGKGARSGSETNFPDTPPGVLRRMVPQWLSEPALSMYVAGFEPALPRHGGAGALYVQLRRSQPGTEG
jgi:DNA-nicking Smr family endonuclease